MMVRYFTRIAHLALAAVALVMLLACQRRPPGTGSEPAYEAHLLDNPKGFDPAVISDVLSLKVAAQLYMGLVSIDERGQLKPALAKSWKTQDGRVWTFELQPEIRFCDDTSFEGGRGRAVTADDVKFSLRRVVEKTTASPAAWMFLDLVDGAREYYEGKAADVAGFVVRDPQTFEIRLRQPHFGFLHRLATNYAWVAAPEAVRRHGTAFADHPVGAGQFCFVSRSLDQEVLLRRKNPGSTGISRLRFRIVKDPVLALQLFRRGALHEYELAVEQLPQVANGPKLKPEFSGFQWINQPGLNWYFVGINMADPVLGGYSERKRLLRQALQRAVNTDVLSRRVLFGGAEPLRRLFPQVAQVLNPELPDIGFDRNAAAGLLARAGYPGGRGLPPLRFITLNTDEAKAVAAQLQADWGAVGIRSEYEQRDFPTLVDLVLKGKSPVTLLFIDAISTAPDYAVQFFLPDGPFNFFGYRNPDLGRLYQQVLRTRDEEERNRVYARMENLILQDVPWVLLYSRNKMILLQKGVKGYSINALGQVAYAGVSLE
jgi:ABC-type transport system substrate-binding protein